MIALRLARPGDAEALLAIYRPYVEETSITFETAVPSPGEFRRRIADISARFPYLVAEADGVPVGYAYAHRFHERAAFDWTAETSIYVDRDHRGQGVGRLLYRALLRLLEAQGIQTVCAVITIPNDASIGFHEALGFREQGRLDRAGFKLGAWHSVAYLCLRFPELSAPPSPVRDIGALPGVQKILENL